MEQLQRTNELLETAGQADIDAILKEEPTAITMPPQSPDSLVIDVSAGFTQEDDIEATSPSIRETLTLQAAVISTAVALGLYAANGGRAHRARHLKMQNGGLNQKQPMPKEQKILRRRKRR